MDNVRTQWSASYMGFGELFCQHRWACKEEVDPLREGSSKELRGDGADVHRKSGISVVYDLQWEEVVLHHLLNVLRHLSHTQRSGI